MSDRLLDKAVRDRFLDKVEIVPRGCWSWTAYVDGRGYGKFKLDGRMTTAHRVAYELFVGPIADGLHVDHLCRNRRCVNPAHLEAVTERENILRGIGATARNARKVQCINGHPFDADNTYRRPDGGRVCRVCNREAVRRRRTALS